MPTLSRDHRRLLENTVAQARTIAVDGARKVLTDQYAVHHHEPWPHMTYEERELRNQLRAHGRQLGDRRDDRRDTQEIDHLVQACAYEHWHHMLFARFLAENDLLLDADHGMAMTLEEVRELAREQSRDWLDIATELAQKMLLAVFRPDDPVLRVSLPPETRQQLEEKLATLPPEVFRADDSLGWVYQFWQRDEKDRVNKSEVKIGADELPAVTQLFTEDYMVLFLLENTLGAWWVAKRRAEGKDPALPGYQWTYLRFNEDGSPTAGAFDSWPRTARELRVLDPSMGSGHFLTFALPILVRMRVEEEGLKLQEAVIGVLQDNLYGLELDARCSQIAAFNLALAAWRLVGEHIQLPSLNLACSGLRINASEADWLKLAGGDGLAREEMRRVYSLFKDAPILGSLIDPLRLSATVFSAGADRIMPLIEEALKEEQTDDARELAIAAKGVLDAFRILVNRYTLVATNVPYLGRGGQSEVLSQYCDEFHADAKHDLATSVFERCNRFRTPGGSVALVVLQSWLFMGPYKRFRTRLLNEEEWNLVARLGPRAFETITGEIVNVALCVLSAHKPFPGHTFSAIDAVNAPTPVEKATTLRSADICDVLQAGLLKNPDARFVITAAKTKSLLSDYADCYKGVATGDLPRFIHQFWETPRLSGSGWECFQGAPRTTLEYAARDQSLFWEGGSGRLHKYVAEKLGPEGVGAWIRGAPAWSRAGVAIAQMSSLTCTLYGGDLFDENTGALVPKDPAHLAAIWAFCSSSEYSEAVRAIDHSLKVPTLTLLKVPFDLAYWESVASETYPAGLPKPHTDDPTQWLFDGHPKGSNSPLHVAVARLVGYQWPRQTGSTFPDCPAAKPDGLDKHADSDGIVPLNAMAGEASAADRLRAVLGDAYGNEWSALRLQTLLSDARSLDEWLRDSFFEEHCRMFYQRPFIWHVWDGRKDGFHALVNYHRLVGPAGEGRKTLERLIYTYLGRWIEHQNDEIRAGKEGADARLTAALHLKTEMEKILAGEKPYDIFVRWKPLHEQPIGWEPDINDGIRLNVRPWLMAKLGPSTKPKKGACVLRVTPKVPYGKDRGMEPNRSKQDFPWFWSWDELSDDFLGGPDFDGARWNDLHYSLATKQHAVERKRKAGA